MSLSCPIEGERPIGLAPIVLFAHARPDHLARALESLAKNAEAASTDLHVYCDGPRDESERPRVDRVRRLVDSIKGFASVRPILRSQNLGLSQSVIQGVSEVLNQFDRAIVLEDDLVLSPYFLQYMNASLQQYATNERVASVHGYCYPTHESLPETFFLRGADCWGWATWSRAWEYFEPDGEKLLQQLVRRDLIRDFELDGAFPFGRMLQEQIAGRNDSWAIRWHASCYLREMLTLYPGRSLVDNIGHDGTGRHSAVSASFSGQLSDRPIIVQPIPLKESTQARQAFSRFGRSQTSLLAGVTRKLRRAMDAWK